jgi:hypothetical protein
VGPFVIGKKKAAVVAEARVFPENELNQFFAGKQTG